MDAHRFDRLTRVLGGSASRRAAAAALLASLLAPLLPMADAESKRRAGKGKIKSRKKNGGEGNTQNKDNGSDKSAGKRRHRGNAKPARKQPARAEAAACCSTGNCSPGKGKNLQKCCYTNQNLSGKNFSGANLGGANFAGATLGNTNLRGANLSKACFVDANFTGVTFSSSTNLDGVVYCRTQTDRGENNSGCAKGTACCPTCDAANPCGPGKVCCDGRCMEGDCCDTGACGNGKICCDHRCTAGECCQTADCPNEICQRRRCDDHQCVYTPVSGAPGPRCPAPRVCCQDAQGDPTCCPAGATICDQRGLCCTPETSDQTCAVGTAAPKCGEVTNTCGQNVDCGPCAERICQDGTCTGEGETCQYSVVFGKRGPQCQSICCTDFEGDPICCAAGISICQNTGVCGCAGDQDCGSNELCCNEQCVSGICCQAQDCDQRTCQERACVGFDCEYTPVLGKRGPGCDTVCCKGEGVAVCCQTGVTACQSSGSCACLTNQDCGNDEICCTGDCIANDLCCNGDPGTCPAPGVCHERACSGETCQPRAVTGGSCPFSSGGTGACNQGSCVCPSPRIVCSDGCCSTGATACKADGTCNPGCDICPSGCAFTTLAAAVAARPAGSTIRICPGTYPTGGVTITKTLTIVGAGDDANGTILDGEGTRGLLVLVDAGAMVTIRDLTVTRAGPGNPAFRFNAGTNVTMERVQVTANTPGVSPAGGILTAATLLLKQCRITNNSATTAGGIQNAGVMTLDATRIEGNRSATGAGIINNTGARTTLTNGSVVTGNLASGGRDAPVGAGIRNSGTVVGATTSNVFENCSNAFGDPRRLDNCLNTSPNATGCPA